MKIIATQLNKWGLYTLLLAILAFASCNRNEQPAPVTDTQLAKEFIYKYTSQFYLWEEYIPAGIDINNYTNPEDLFEYMYYPTLDHWSFVTDDFQVFLNSLNGTRKAAGYKFQLFKYTAGGDDVYGIVEYVHTDGEAYKAGLERGDVIISVDGQKLTVNNYQDLLYQDEMELGIGAISDGQVVDLNEKLNITRKEQSFSPILQYQMIDKGGKKIGYFLYDQFISDYEDELVTVMTTFKNQNIDELVLDLRYNPGGYVTTCAALASMIVPASNLDDVFLTQQWNSILTEELKKEPDADKYFTMNFPTPSTNLNLTRLIVLCSDRTASASEALVNCLKPYMTVVLIGEQTSGKYTGANFFYDGDKIPAHTWGLYLVTTKIANADGVTDFIYGFTPDYLISDDYITPLGDQTEPLLAKALEVVTGIVTKSTRKLPEAFTIIGHGYESRIEKNGVMVQENLNISENSPNN